MRTCLASSLALALCFAACAKKGSSGADDVSRSQITEKEESKADPASKNLRGGPDTGERDAPDTDNRKVIRTGRIELVVPSYDDARGKLEAILKSTGGYIDSTEVTHRQGAVSDATIVLRLPSKSFGSIIPKLRELGEITAETTNAADITDQYVDVAARLASEKVLEKRLLELAADRSGTVDSVLAVERELARVRGEIESYEGRLRQWNDQIALSTFTLHLATKAPEIADAPSRGLGERISSGFHSSISSLGDFGSWLAIALIALLPWLLLVIPSVVIGRRLWRRFGARVLPTAVARPVTAPTTQPPPAA